MNTAHTQRHAISPRQIKALHATINTIGMDDDTYRAMLQSRYRAKSCKDLTWRQAEELLESLNGNPPQPPFGKGGSGRRGDLPYSDLDGRPGMASGAQCRMIAAMWSEVSRMPTAAEKERALGGFLKRITGVEALRFLKSWQVEKVVSAIKAMKKAKEENPC